MNDLYDQLVSFAAVNPDLLWLPVSFLAVHRHQRLKTLVFVVACLLTLRTQAELMDWTGFSHGFLPFFTSAARTRGMVVYGLIIVLFLVLARLSPRSTNLVFFTVMLMVYIFALCVSMVVMAL